MVNQARYMSDTYDAWRLSSNEPLLVECDKCGEKRPHDYYDEDLDCCGDCAIKEYESRIKEMEARR